MADVLEYGIVKGDDVKILVGARKGCKGTVTWVGGHAGIVSVHVRVDVTTSTDRFVEFGMYGGREVEVLDE